MHTCAHVHILESCKNIHTWTSGECNPAKTTLICYGSSRTNPPSQIDPDSDLAATTPAGALPTRLLSSTATFVGAAGVVAAHFAQALWDRHLPTVRFLPYHTQTRTHPYINARTHAQNTRNMSAAQDVFRALFREDKGGGRGGGGGAKTLQYHTVIQCVLVYDSVLQCVAVCCTLCC